MKSVSFLLLLISFSTHAGEIAFKNPSVSVEAFQKELSDSSSTVALISGAGPAGLFAALALEKTDKFSHIVMSDYRTKFDRINTISFQDESLPMLQRLGIFDRFKQLAIFAEQPRLFFLPWTESSFSIEDKFVENADLSPNYSAQPSELFSLALPHYAIEIAVLQDLLNEEILRHKRIFLLHGKIDIFKPSDAQFASARFVPTSESKLAGIEFKQPSLILISEGAHSESRAKLGIDSKPIEGREVEHWCSGVVSLKGIVDEHLSVGHISLLSNKVNKTGTFGVFRPGSHDLFLNGKESSPVLDAEHCLKTHALELMQIESTKMSLRVPNSLDDLSVKPDQSSKFDLTLRISDKFSAYENVILVGDAASNGSPVGGLGATLIASTYVEALQSLVKNIFDDKMTRQSALERYSKRVMEIVLFWHSRTIIQ